jgi:hypothetical protein
LKAKKSIYFRGDKVIEKYAKAGLATALYITSFSSVVDHTSSGIEKELNSYANAPYEAEYLQLDKIHAVAGNIAINSNIDFVPVHTEISTEELEVELPNSVELLEPVEVTNKAVRLGNARQLAEPPPPPPELPPPNPIPNFFNWLNIAQCESGGNWSINTGNGYYGGLQFSRSSWEFAGGLKYASRPDFASVEHQMLTAEVLLSLQGWRAWPTCSRKVGLR